MVTSFWFFLYASVADFTSRFAGIGIGIGFTVALSSTGTPCLQSRNASLPCWIMRWTRKHRTHSIFLQLDRLKLTKSLYTIFLLLSRKTRARGSQAEPLRKEARSAMIKKVRQLRRAHEQLAAARASSSTSAAGRGVAAEDGKGAGDERDKGGVGLEASMPEYVLPYAIHLLAHHPDFPVDKVRGMSWMRLSQRGGKVGSLSARWPDVFD